jgi:hypothetical protein
VLSVPPASSREAKSHQQWPSDVAMHDVPRFKKPSWIYQRKAMKTKQEIKDEIIELYGATQALGDAMNILHAQRMEKSKQMMALNQMLKEMEEGDE